jgi:hypothetical protein
MLPDGTKQLVEQCAIMLPGLRWEPHESAIHTMRPAAFGYDDEGRSIIVGATEDGRAFDAEVSYYHERTTADGCEVYVNTSGSGRGDTPAKAYVAALARYDAACAVRRPTFPTIPA